MATDNAQLIEQRLPDNSAGLIDPAAVRAVAQALDNQVPNQRRGGPFLVTFLTHAQAVAAGQPTAASLDQLEADRLCLGSTARVARHPDQAGQWLVLVYDAQATAGQGSDGGGPLTTGLPVALDGNFQLIVPGKWVKLGSTEATAANVPAYAGNVSYPLSYLVRYGLPGGRESFYYSLQAGQLPAPVPGQSSASWRLVPGPVAETTLFQYLTLDEAQGIDSDRVVAGRRYEVVGKWNGSADDQVVFLDGLDNYFRQRGTVLHADGSQQEVSVSVGLGTYAAGVALGQGAQLRFDQDYEWPTLSTGPVTATRAGAVVGAVVRVRLGAGVDAPVLPAGFTLLGAGQHTAGHVNLYCFCVAANGSVDYFIQPL